MAHLARVDQLLLWGMRAWVMAMQQRVDVVAPLQAAFARFQITQAAELLDALMCVVACGASRVLTIECVCCASVSDDEQRLLAAAAACQCGQGLEATFVLRTILGPAACRDACEILHRLGSVMTSGGCELSRWELATERLVFDRPGDTRQSHVTIH